MPNREYQCHCGRLFATRVALGTHQRNTCPKRRSAREVQFEYEQQKRRILEILSTTERAATEEGEGDE